jgi:ADP-ribosylglycohydrolase
MREKDSRGTLRELLQDSGEWPLDDYISERTIEPYWERIGRKPSWFTGGNPALREYIEYCPADDDLNYTLISLKLVQNRGRQFTPDDTLQAWIRNLPFSAVCTAEKVAYRNRTMGMRYPQTATFLNPYREWIGAQIRTDFYGYICPGCPAEAAAMAWNDAACSHTKNGIYGAMWVSAAIAAAFVENDPEAVIRRGLEQVPADCRFTEHMLRTIDSAKKNGRDVEATFDDIEERLAGYHCVHTIPNACIVAAALLHAGQDWGRAACIAVMGGYDTDCNGATAGSIAGIMLGKSRIEDRWLDPLNDTLHSAVSGYNVSAISELVEQTIDIIDA